MTNILALDTPTPRYPVGATFTMTRTPSNVAETVTARVDTVRMTAHSGWIYTLAIDSGKKHAHWRVIFERALTGRIVETAVAKAA